MKTSGAVVGLVLAFGAVRAAEPLPAGARARIGPTIYVGNQSVVLVPPDYSKLAFGDRKLGIRFRNAADGTWLDDSDQYPTGEVVVSGDGSRAVMLFDRKYRFWDLKSRAELPPLVEMKKETPSVPRFTESQFAISHDGRTFARVGRTSDKEFTVLVWDVAAGRTAAEIKIAERTLPRVSLSPDGTELATWYLSAPLQTEAARTVTTWDAKTGVEKFQFRTAGPHPINVLYSPDGVNLVVSSLASIEVFNARTSKPVTTMHGRLGQGRWMAISPDGKTLAGTGWNDGVERWSLPDGKYLGYVPRPADAAHFVVHGLAFTNNERLLLWGVIESVAATWQPMSGTVTVSGGRRSPVHKQSVVSLAFSTDGHVLVSSDRSGKVLRWAADTGDFRQAVEHSLSAGSGHNWSLSSEGDRGYTVGSHWTIIDFSVADRHFALPGSPTGGGRTLLSAVTPDHARGVMLLVPYDLKRTGQAESWDLAGRKRLCEFELPGAPPFGGDPAAAITPKGTRVLLTTHTYQNSRAAREGFVHAWDAADGKKISTTSFPEMYGGAAIAAADERTAVVVARGASWLHPLTYIRVVDIERGTMLRSLDPILEPRSTAGRPIAFNPDRTRLAVAVHAAPTKPPTIRLYEWPSGKWLKSFTGHSMDITALAFSPDGMSLASGSQDASILLWDLPK